MNKLVVVAVVVAMMLGFALYAEAGNKGSIVDLLKGRQGAARPAIVKPALAGHVGVAAVKPAGGKLPKIGKPAGGKLPKIGKPATGKPLTIGSLLKGK